MTIESNSVFKDVCKQYDLATVLESTIEIPEQLRLLLEQEVLVSDDRIGIPPFGQVMLKPQQTQNTSHIEDSANHFHISSYVGHLPDNIIFELSVQMLRLLALKLETDRITGVRCWLSFESKEMARFWTKRNNLHNNEDEYYVNDRLSLFLRRPEESIIEIDQSDRTEAILIIDV